MSRAMRFAVGAAGLAVQDAGLERGRENPERIGVVMGTGLVPVDLPELTPALVAAADDRGRLQTPLLGQNGSAALFPLWILKYLPNMLACHVTIIHELKGPSNTITCADASSHLAIGEAFRTIQRRCEIFVGLGSALIGKPRRVAARNLGGSLQFQPS